MAWLYLVLAIAAEIAATLALRGAAESPRLSIYAGVVVGYVAAFGMMALALKELNVGVVYAIWSGVGTAAVAAIAAVVYGERMNLVAVGGIGLIVGGVVVLSLSGASAH